MIESFKKVLNSDVFYQIRVSTVTNQPQSVIKEDGIDSKIKTLIIENMPDDKNAIIFTLDFSPPQKGHKSCYQQPSLYLNKSNQEGINKSCDVVIVYSRSSNWNVLLIDLKSDEIKPKKIKLQLDNSELFLNYIFSLLNFYYQHPIPNKIKKIVLTTNPRNTIKSNTYGPNTISSDLPQIIPVSVDRFQKGSINFNDLA